MTLFFLHPVVIKEVFLIYFGWVTTTWCAGFIMKSMHYVHHGVPVSGYKVKFLGENTRTLALMVVLVIKRRIKLKGAIHSSPNSIVIEEKSWFFYHIGIRRGIKVKIDFFVLSLLIEFSHSKTTHAKEMSNYSQVFTKQL